MTVYWHYDTPLGELWLGENDSFMTRLCFAPPEESQAEVRETPLLARAAGQLIDYLNGRRTAFALPLAPCGTPFQRAVWQALLTIPYGGTRSYGEIARQLKKPGAVRAVGMANHANPLPVFIPCHRVIGSDGSLTGYAGGLAVKAALLELEKGGTLR